jgi:hypothetical protein
MGTPWQHTISVEAQHISAAIQYVVDEQGDAMSVFEPHEL